jgi:subtilase family serine protease
MVQYDAANNGPMVLPDNLTVVVDQGLQERECNETNNQVTVPVTPGQPEPDLRVALAAPSPMPTCPTLPTTVYNDGSAPASGIVVRYYAGDPNQGGTALYDFAVPGTLAAGGVTSFDASIPAFPQGLSVQIWAVVDPNNTVAECNDGNNNDAANGKIECGGIN